jgi:Calcineurin-like phosphoesterase
MESTYPRTRASVVVTSQPIVLNRTRVFVTGDIHGRSDLLDRMVDYMSRDLDNPTSDCVTVTLGDYIDRGPDSRGVLDRLVRNPFPTALVALKGNHEAPLEMFSNDPAVAEHWQRLGGSRRCTPTACPWQPDDGPELRASGGRARGRGAGRAFQIFCLADHRS